MGWKKLISKVEMPSDDDPKYQYTREKAKSLGQKLVRFLRLDKLMRRLQIYAMKMPKRFLIIVCSIVALAFGYNIYHITHVVRHYNNYKNSIKLEQTASPRRILRSQAERNAATEAEVLTDEKSAPTDTVVPLPVNKEERIIQYKKMIGNDTVN